MLFFSSFSQNDSLLEIPEWMGNSCEKGEELAIRDYKLGVYKIFNFGLPVMSEIEWDYSDFYKEYLMDNYNIQSKHLGCVMYETAVCYSNKMKDLIENKNGDDYFEKINKEAKVLYNSYIQGKIDREFVFKFADTMPEFVGGKDSLLSFLRKNIKYPKTIGSYKGTVYCQFIIEKDGSISNIEIIKGLEENFDNESIRVIQLMPNWNPGIHLGKAVSCKMVLPIKYK